MDTKALRQKILDLAIRGKLVPQDPSDEPASVLLEKIREEKARMVKDGKLKKKDIKNDSIIYVGEDNLHYEKFQDGTVKCIENEIPFELPEGWAWSRLHPLTIKIGAGSTPAGGAAVYSNSGIKFIRSQNVYDNGLVLNDVAYISEEINQKKSGSIVKPQDILLNITGGSIGRCALVPDDFDIANVNQHVLIIRLVEVSLRQYIHSVIISPYIQEQILSKQVGSGRGGLSAETTSSFLIPIPPIQEQYAIQDKLQQCISCVSEIAIEKTNIINLVSKAKDKILDLAIRGQLVPQDPNDEPASVLLDHIRAEKDELVKQGKIKRDKKESIIFKGEDNSYYEKLGEDVRCIDEEIPYDIPDSWEWVRLKNCCIKEIRRGKSPKYTAKSNTLVFAQKCNTKYNGIDIGLALYLDESTLGRYPNEEYIHDSDVVVNSTGTGTLGRIGFYRTTDNIPGLPIVPDSHVTVIRGFRSIRAFYLYIFMKANQSVLEKKGEGSTNQKELKPITLKEMLVPMPPASEQQRIENAIITAFSFVEMIEKSLN